jgi:hypothetical protein
MPDPKEVDPPPKEEAPGGDLAKLFREIEDDKRENAPSKE